MILSSKAESRKEDLVPDWVHEICIAMLTNENAFWKISGLYQTWLEDMILPRELQGQKLWTCWITFLFCPVQLCFRIRQTAGLKKIQTKLGKYFTVMFYFPHSMSIIRCAISERIFIKWFCKNSSRPLVNFFLFCQQIKEIISNYLARNHKAEHSQFKGKKTRWMIQFCSLVGRH